MLFAIDKVVPVVQLYQDMDWGLDKTKAILSDLLPINHAIGKLARQMETSDAASSD